MPESTPHTNKTILLVEDDQPTCSLLTAALTHAGYIVTCAAKRTEVLALVRFHPFDLILTGVVTPEVDGTEVISTVKRYRTTTPVIAMSGDGFGLSGKFSLKLTHAVGAHVP